MIEPNVAPHSFSRLKSHIGELETLASLICELDIAPNPIITHAIERLIELAGTNDFMPAFSSLQIIILQTKWAREDRFGAGYIVPWLHVYACLGDRQNSKLASIANGLAATGALGSTLAVCATQPETGMLETLHALPTQRIHYGNTARSAGNSREVNPYGAGSFPAELNINEIATMSFLENPKRQASVGSTSFPFTPSVAFDTTTASYTATASTSHEQRSYKQQRHQTAPSQATNTAVPVSVGVLSNSAAAATTTMHQVPSRASATRQFDSPPKPAISKNTINFNPNINTSSATHTSISANPNPSPATMATPNRMFSVSPQAGTSNTSQTTSVSSPIASSKVHKTSISSPVQSIQQFSQQSLGQHYTTHEIRSVPQAMMTGSTLSPSASGEIAAHSMLHKPIISNRAVPSQVSPQKHNNNNNSSSSSSTTPKRIGRPPKKRPHVDMSPAEANASTDSLDSSMSSPAPIQLDQEMTPTKPVKPRSSKKQKQAAQQSFDSNTQSSSTSPVKAQPASQLPGLLSSPTEPHQASLNPMFFNASLDRREAPATHQASIVDTTMSDSLPLIDVTPTSKPSKLKLTSGSIMTDPTATKSSSNGVSAKRGPKPKPKTLPQGAQSEILLQASVLKVKSSRSKTTHTTPTPQLTVNPGSVLDGSQKTPSTPLDLAGTPTAPIQPRTNIVTLKRQKRKHEMHPEIPLNIQPSISTFAHVDISQAVSHHTHNSTHHHHHHHHHHHSHDSLSPVYPTPVAVAAESHCTIPQMSYESASILLASGSPTVMTTMTATVPPTDSSGLAIAEMPWRHTIANQNTFTSLLSGDMTDLPPSNPSIHA